jgi:hypothetical protein
MSGEFYVASDIASAFTTARIEPIESEFASIEAGFDKLPALRKLREGRITYVVAGGSANALTASLDSEPDDYQDGLALRIKIASTNTGAATLNVNSLGAVSVVDRNGSALAAGTLVADTIAEVVYVGSSFRLTGSAADVAATAANAAAASASASAASGSASAASTSASNASDDADAAAVSAAAALVSEGNASDSETAAAASAAAASDSATDAANAAAASLRATSATEHTTGTGSKAFTLDADAAFGPGQSVSISSDSDPSNENMTGAITAYDPGTDVLTVDITTNNVTVPHTDWTIVLDVGGGVTWGNITGSISGQTDLNSALSGKAGTGSITSGGITMATARILGRTTASTGAVQEISIGAGLSLAAGSLACTVTGMTYPGVGIAVSTGSGWDTSKAAPSGTIVGTSDTQTLTAKTLQSSTIRADNTVSDDGTVAVDSPGYRGTPRQTGTARTLLAADDGKLVSLTGNLTLPQSLPIGFTCMFYNNSSGSLSVLITSGTLRLAGTATTGTRTVAQRGLATITQVATDEWVIGGAGVT